MANPQFNGAVAQLGEHLLCKQGVSGSIPLSSTKLLLSGVELLRLLPRVREEVILVENKVCGPSALLVLPVLFHRKEKILSGCGFGRMSKTM